MEEITMVQTLPEETDAPPSRRALALWSLRRCYALIFSGELGPGDEVDVSALTERLGVSRSPLREALNQLETDGLVYASRSNGRRYVGGFGAADVDELYEIRLALEVPSVRAAALQIEEVDIDELRALLLEMRSPALDSSGSGRDLAADMAFHERIVLASGLKRMHRTLVPIWLQTRAMLAQFDSRGLFPEDFDLEEDVAEHASVVESLARHDADAAERALIEHLRRARHEAHELFASAGQPDASTSLAAAR
jgi:DNA-binding GntR family transcriptional regulator